MEVTRDTGDRTHRSYLRSERKIAIKDDIKNQEFRPQEPMSYTGKLGEYTIDRLYIGIPGYGTYTGEQGKWMLRFNVGYNNPIVLIYLKTDAEVEKFKSRLSLIC